MQQQNAIRQLRAGDVSALEYVVRAHQIRAIRTAYLIIGDRGLAEEVVQEAFLRLPRTIRTFDPTMPFEPWFLRIVVNASLKLVNRAGHEIPLNADESRQTLERFAASLDSPQSQVEARDLEDRVRRALDSLSPRQRAVIVQRYYLDMSEAEMAVGSGTAAGTIKWLLHAARRRLRGALAERSDE